MNDTHDNPTTPIDEQLWQCPECGHEMTERESKLYRGCPTGMHFVQHIKVRKEQPLPNPTTGEWTVRELPIGFYGLFSGDTLLSDDFHDERSANVVRDAHNAALAAEREITFAAQQAALKEGIRSGKLETQLAEAVEALKLAKYRIINPTQALGESAYDVLDAALAKIGAK